MHKRYMCARILYGTTVTRSTAHTYTQYIMRIQKYSAQYRPHAHACCNVCAFSKDCHVNVSLLPVHANKWDRHFFPTNVVVSEDFSVYFSLTESEKQSLEGTFSPDCHVNVSVLPVGANKCTPSFLSDQCCPKWGLFRLRGPNGIGKTVIRRRIFERFSCEGFCVTSRC